MRKSSICLFIVALMFAACASKQHHNPMSADKGDKELHPTMTTSSWERSETGPLTGKDTTLVETIVSVEKLNHETREMTVRNFQGLREKFIVSPQVRRLNEIKVGDKIALTYSRSLAFEVRKPTPSEIANPRMLASDMKKAGLELPPGMTHESLSHVLVTIQETDLAANTVTVRLPEGNSLKIVARYPENLTRVKAGDTVAVTYGTALAVEVQPVS